MSDVTTVSKLVVEDLGRVVILTRSRMENGHLAQGNVIGILVTIQRKGKATTLIVNKKGKLVSGAMEWDWAVIFPTKAHPLFPKEG